MNITEQEERIFIELVKDKLRINIEKIDENIQSYAEQLRENKEFFYENKSEMDKFESYGMRMAIARGAISGENAVELKKRLNKLLLSPFFGRIDFTEAKKQKVKQIYIGIQAFMDVVSRKNIIYDWRAPISSMFYDFELGKAWYRSPSGRINGEINLKRQYRIVNGNLEFMLDTALNIHDEILQKELSLSSDERMKNIVATIQRDQNAIIRNEKAEALIIQGVAGSGKTSVALHRIAFLLYRFKENIRADEILIISPNKVFADYISGVLPELGEENIPEIGMDTLAEELLDKKFKFQTFYQQVQKLLEDSDEDYRERISYKSNAAFLSKMNEYLVFVENSFFNAEDIWIKKCFVPSWFIEERFKSLHRLTIQNRIPQIVKDIEENIKIFYLYDISTEERNVIRMRLKNMLKLRTLRDYYISFYDWLEMPHLFKTISRQKLEYSDVFPLIYMKSKLEGYKKYDKVKHLLIDEMQDYNFIQYTVIANIFSCKKTILGDYAQSVNPFSSSSAADIRKVFPDAEYVKLTKSYRSTYEIMEFSQNILPAKDMVAIKRRGEKPVILSLENVDKEIKKLCELIDSFRNTGYQSLGILCKTQKQANNLYGILIKKKIVASLLNEDSAVYAHGVIVCPINLAKGLEFDMVIVPETTNKNYNQELERNLLYIACTRTMHKLVLTYSGKISTFVENIVL
ncbi:MAG: AAA family ATPase [Bacteroidales bacterium]|nr:AAA family ATPase [Bacteroidales bacterium]